MTTLTFKSTPCHRIHAAAQSAARIGVRTTRRTSANRALFSCPSYGGLCAGAERLAGPSPGTPTAHNPPPFIGVKGGGLFHPTRRLTMAHRQSVHHLDAQTLYENAFHAYREPRSKAYRDGALVAIQYRLGETHRITTPFEPGTPDADAWHAGTEEGHAIARAYLHTINGREV